MPLFVDRPPLDATVPVPTWDAHGSVLESKQYVTASLSKKLATLAVVLPPSTVKAERANVIDGAAIVTCPVDGLV
jgi:hypothetical protein